LNVFARCPLPKALAFPGLTAYRFHQANNRRTREVAGDEIVLTRPSKKAKRFTNKL
jgi:hypothetical protein